MGGLTSQWKVRQADVDNFLSEASMAHRYVAMRKENKQATRLP
jgi:hypothetical protein